MPNQPTEQLDPWQQRVMECQTDMAIRSGRQSGKSFIISRYAGEYATHNDKKTVLIIAATERQAYLLFEKVLAYMADNYNKLIMTGKNRPTKSMIKLKNGSVIYCLPTGASGYGIRGFTIDLLIADEAAYIPEDVWSAVTPMMATRRQFGARMILLSTPFGRDTPARPNFFARCFSEPTFTTFHVSSEECPRIDKTFLEQERKRMTKLQYTQEYLGEFVDELMQWFPDTLIRKCMIRERPGYIKKGGFLGVDLARMGKDLSVFAIGHLVGDKVIHTEHQITSRTYLNESTNHILALNRQYDFEKIFIDDEGIGVGVFDYLMENEETRRKTVAINNSKRVTDYHDETKTKLLKEDLYNNLLRLMERGEIEFLKDEEIFQSLKSVQYEYGSDPFGRPHLKIFGNNTHTAEALIRLAWCVKYKSLNSLWIKSF